MTRFLVGLVLSLAACQPAPVGVRNVELQPDSTPQCGALCAQIGLPLDSVVIMANNVGCVCRAAPPAQTPGAAPGASASAGGMAAIMLAEEAARQAAAQQQRNNASYKPVKY